MNLSSTSPTMCHNIRSGYPWQNSSIKGEGIKYGVIYSIIRLDVGERNFNHFNQCNFNHDFVDSVSEVLCKNVVHFLFSISHLMLARSLASFASLFCNR